jgi:hypothetical protein
MIKTLVKRMALREVNRYRRLSSLPPLDALPMGVRRDNDGCVLARCDIDEGYQKEWDNHNKIIKGYDIARAAVAWLPFIYLFDYGHMPELDMKYQEHLRKEADSEKLYVPERWSAKDTAHSYNLKLTRKGKR